MAKYTLGGDPPQSRSEEILMGKKPIPQSRLEELLMNKGSGSVTPATPRVAMTASDTTPSLDPNKLYVFPEMVTLTPTLATPTDNTIVNEYHFIFTSGATATTTTFPAIPGLDDFAAEANMVYEVSILEGLSLVTSWAVTA